ncbi:MAG: sulfur carrier protein ThiS [Phascolarctobacterium sp.]|uniref:sulfur carrier protein ThiS n=1 Tax=Phascolarctobacterium sp. TaxID=2049039 RepID=UPI0025F6C117|nr:sulfur carrier protein ThiS [Phascolarctobacterium sp.]MCC8158616.1 sulfur carrier protein ThiS [Phascolarctobacterium sp.]
MQINGQAVSAAAGITLAQLLAQQGFDAARVAVELNGRIISRSDFDAVQLADDDTVEVVQFVGGG